MKLIRFGEKGKEKPGIVKDNVYYDVSAIVKDYDEDFFEDDGIKSLASKQVTSFPKVANTVRLGCPVAKPSKIVCIGLNYADHAKETNATPPAEPVIFLKSTTAIIGPNDDVVIPKDSVKTDWEVELAIVIGKKASYVE